MEKEPAQPHQSLLMAAFPPAGPAAAVSVVHEEQWSAQGISEQPSTLQPREAVEFRHGLPPHARSSHLDADKPLFCELEVKPELPGLDFEETYLVPVYMKT